MDELKELFCGGTDKYPDDTTFKPKSQPWDTTTLIGHLTMDNIVLPAHQISELKPVLWNDLCSEYDADNFCNYLKDEGFKLSQDFKAFEFVWRRDEHNHYVGFRHIYSTLYYTPNTQIVGDLTSRPVDFKPISHLLEDEFKICLLLAYDEIATTKSYAADYDLYNSFGHENFLKWIKKVTRDEAYHFNNCMELVGKNYPDRIHEIPKLVDQFIEWDLSGGEYKGTFILDHDGHYFTEDFLLDCGRIMKRYFR